MHTTELGLLVTVLIVRLANVLHNNLCNPIKVDKI
jgi:hypothetical protein